MDPSNLNREPLNTTNQTQTPLVVNQTQNTLGISVVQPPSAARSNPLNPLQLFPRTTTYEPNCCLLYCLKWYFYFLGIALYFYLKAGYQILQDQRAFLENGVLAIDFIFCVYPVIFIIIEAYAIIMANKKAAWIAIWGFVSYFLLYLIYVLVLYYGVAKDQNEKDKILNGAMFWLAFYIGTTFSGCYCVYSELCKYHQERASLSEQRTDVEGYSRV